MGSKVVLPMWQIENNKYLQEYLIGLTMLTDDELEDNIICIKNILP